MLKKIITLLILGMLVFSCSLKTSKDKKHNGKMPVKNYTIKKGNIQVKMEETGLINPIKEIKIKSVISGRIVKLYFDEGDYITVGDTIAEIEPDFNQAREIFNIKHNLELKEIELANKKKDLDYKKELYEKKYVAEQELINAQTTYRQTEISYQLALQQYNLVKDINFDQKYSPVISKVSGAVLEKPVEEGETVTSSMSSYNNGTVMYKLADLTKLIINLNINEIDIGKIWKNQKTAIQVDAFPYKKYHGKISTIGVMAKPSNSIQAFPVKVEIKDLDENLKPGMTANVTIFGDRRDSIIVIPIRTIFADDEGNDIVYKVESDSVTTATPIKTGINNLEMVEVISGLDVDDKISYSEPEKGDMEKVEKKDKSKSKRGRRK